MADESWVAIQKKTFTKWMNSHLRKKAYPAIVDAQEDFENGVNLMHLINSLYNIPIPKHNKDPKMRPHKLDNISLAIGMVDQAQIKTNFLKPMHLADKDLKMILGMVWAIILDFQIKGISVEELTAKEGLLLWCQKKTAGYKDVKVDNFSNSWQDGLAFCALIHRHRPDLLDFSTLSKANARENLELAFTVAEQKLGIARLLDPEDILNVPKPDERSIMTYVSEYFHCFASQDVKEKSAARVQKFVQFNMQMEESEKEYERNADALLSWINATIETMNNRDFGDTMDQAKALFEQYKKYMSTDKPAKSSTKLDLESAFAAVQTKLAVYNRKPYDTPQGYSPEDIDAAWDRLERAEKARGAALRENMFKYITKAKTTISEDQLKEFEASFNHFDKDKSGALDRLEFRAALQALSIPFKDEAAFDKLFNQVSEGNPRITKEQFMNYLISISEDKDTPDAVKASFATMADNGVQITRPQLNCHPLQTVEIDYLAERMPPVSTDLYDYSQYVDSAFRN